MMACAGFEREALVAIRALDEMLVAHFQEDAWMTQRPTTAIAGNAGLVGFNHFRDFCRHGNASENGPENG